MAKDVSFTFDCQVWQGSCSAAVWQLAMGSYNCVLWCWMSRNSPWPRLQDIKCTGLEVMFLQFLVEPLLSPSKPQRGMPMILSSQALLSLQSEVLQTFKEKRSDPVRLVWACEKDVGCQKVLSATYGGCCFDDILTMSHKKSKAWCATHCKYCPTAIPPFAQQRYCDEVTVKLCCIIVFGEC